MEATLASPLLNERVRHALVGSPYISPRSVQIEATEGSVKLEGKVGTFYQKQMAQELVRRVDGVKRVENQLQVDW